MFVTRKPFDLRLRRWRRRSRPRAKTDRQGKHILNCTWVLCINCLIKTACLFSCGCGVSVRKKKLCRPTGAGDEPDSRIGPGQRSWESESTQRVSCTRTHASLSVPQQPRPPFPSIIF